MKVPSLILALTVLAGCSRNEAPAATQAQATAAASSTSAATPKKTIAASATGTVESVDLAARTVTIAHGPIATVHWPAMTMTFDAPAADLSAVKPGDQVDFELAVTGMHGEVTKIARR